ncbi:hypothetical protein B0H63DRAFT_485645 [Podospora didyma]|uniref:Uncharacterized protein n=1 Tax=Podospora didyma TaxID=330526 RepID=A0AAE0K560_9PEZI|nr:hypothetical protein B0H63DRAFT_485645 [Podospora didyma]
MGNPLRPAIVYNCRSSYSWPGDIALSITYFPSSGSTYAIFYGCDAKATKEISGRLLEAHGQDVALQPLLIMGIFAELERKRQFRLFDAAHRNLVQIVSRLNNREPRGASPLDDEVDNSEYSVDPWLSVCHLKNGLENWKEQLTRMVEHADELAAAAEKDSKQLGAGGMDKALVDTMRETNSRVRIRLCEIVCDYNEKIRACNMIMDGTTLATQLAHTRANIEIALQTKEDGSQMRSIALLTMIFLPATFVATLFSMSFFNWQPEGDEVTVSPWLWVYFVVAAGLTFISVGTWYLARLRRRRRRRALLLAEKGEEKV